jgi:diacylglycerol kinase family enzyme
MKTLWLITNPSSGSTSRAKCDALEALFEEKGLQLAGRTEFPDEALPAPADLDAQGVDTAVLFAGDGTINAALCALADWRGAFLILPGGTMNLLAKALHGDADGAKIIAAAHDRDHRVALPFIEVGSRRAYVGLILGPAASWVRAREAVRRGRPWRMVAAMRNAWRRTFADHVHVTGAPGLHLGYQAVLVRPGLESLHVTGVDARDWRSIAELGWDWLTGDWVAARAVTETHAHRLRLGGRRPALALFDGEPVMLDAGTEITAGCSPRSFIATSEAV